MTESCYRSLVTNLIISVLILEPVRNILQLPPRSTVEVVANNYEEYEVWVVRNMLHLYRLTSDYKTMHELSSLNSEFSHESLNDFINLLDVFKR